MKNLTIILTTTLFVFTCTVCAQLHNETRTKKTFIMIHLEAGYKGCLTNNLPPGIYIPDEYRLKHLGWQEYFLPTVIELVQKADEYNFKLVLAFNPQWGEYVSNDSSRLNLIKQWKSNGHEIGFHHHGYSHVDWNGYSNRPEVTNDSLFLGSVNDGFSFVKYLITPDIVISSTLSDLPIDFPSQMNISDNDLIFGEGNDFNSYPQFGEVKSLVPYRQQKTNGGYIVHLTIRGFTTGMPISLEEAFPILKEQYVNMKDDEVFGIVWHEFDYYRAKDAYIQWFEFINNQNDKVKTMKEIAEELPGNTSVEHESENIPEEFLLYQNYPNPFNPTTVISYQLPVSSYVRLTVFDILGREVVMLVDEELNAGEHSVQFDSKNLPSGIYIYRLQAGSIVHQKKMTVLK